VNIREAVVEGYRQGYEDAQHGIPARPQDLEVHASTPYEAAPDLLAALEQAFPTDDSGAMFVDDEIVRTARAAIAKARGIES